MCPIRAGRPIDIPTAKKWIDKAKVFNEQKHMSFEIFIRLMDEKLERDEKYQFKNIVVVWKRWIGRKRAGKRENTGGKR